MGQSFTSISCGLQTIFEVNFQLFFEEMCIFATSFKFVLYGEGRPRLDLEYPVYGAHKLAD